MKFINRGWLNFVEAKMDLILTILALIPFLLLFVLIILKRIPAIKAMPFTWLITLAITYFIWKVSFANIGASFVKSFFVAFEIILIIFCAVLLIEVIRQKNQIKILQNFLLAISPDSRIQVIIIAWFFGSLIEGIAGFGVPAALTAPLLVTAGFSPLLSIVLSLIANSTAVSFGAAGTPVLLGLSTLGLSSAVLGEIVKSVALIHAVAGILIPTVLSYLVILHSKEKNKLESLIKTFPFIILSWLVFVIPYYLTAVYIGPELPSIIAGFFGIVVISLFAHFKILTPKNLIRFNKVKHKKISPSKTIKSIFPYIIVILLLAVTRIFSGIKEGLSFISLNMNNLFATEVSYSFLPFYSPSFYFIISVLICLIFYKATKEDFKVSFKNSFNKVKLPFIALLFAVSLVQLLIISSSNSLGFPGIPLLLGESFAFVSQNFYVFVSPFVGVFGSFVAGSNTVSNLLFGLMQSEIAKNLGLSVVLILSLQIVGGAVGNMIAVHNVIAANSVVGLKNSEGTVIRKTIWVVIAYALLAGVIGYLISKFF